MGSFRDQITAFTTHVRATNQAVFVGVVQEAKRSIVEGSELTGAPGQPVGQYGPGYNQGRVGGNLKSSWIEGHPSPTEATLTTNVIYAPNIEHLIGQHGPINIRSTVGGGHSVALTVAGFDRIVAAVTSREVQGASETGFTGSGAGGAA